jgi:diguanylate cyclase (GGDEF)-like protein/PAS domain S-box-containing protein
MPVERTPPVAEPPAAPAALGPASASPEPKGDMGLQANERGPWGRFAAQTLFDYNAASRRLWLSVVVAGSLVGVWALLHTVSNGQWSGALLAATVATLASLAPVHIPRSKHSVSLADVCVYLALALVGPAVAVLAAGAEALALAASEKNSRRMSSRLASSAANMSAMALAGLAFEFGQAALAPKLGSQSALVVALGSAALVVYAASTLPLWAITVVKASRRLSLQEWFGNFAWVGAMAQISALVAALIVINTRLFGPTLIVAVAALVVVAACLLRVFFARREADQMAQDAQLASAHREAELNQQRFTAAFSHAAVGMAIVGDNRQILQVNRALALLLGATEGELLARNFHDFLNPGDMRLLERLQQDLAQAPNETFTVQLRCQRADGEEVWVALHCSRFDDPGSAGPCVIYQLHDITSRHLAEQRLHHIAFHDSLTDLANRACFTERLAQAVERSRLDSSARFAVLFLDLDRFKVVNDSLGHQAGNELLVQVANRLRQCVRPMDLVARLGGDEFAVLCEGLDDHEHARALATRLGVTLAQPLAIHGTEVIPGASIGITFGDLGYRTVDEILRDADLAMYEAKAAGRGRVAVFDASMHERIADRLALEADLRHAIGAGKFMAVFQPIFNLSPMRLAGFEALARWEHPTRGPINPAVFIALAEEAGHIEGVTRWMIDHAVAQLARWRREFPEHARLTMNVNLSSRDLVNPELVAFVERTLAQHDLPPELLTLEITETTLMNRLQPALATLHALRAMGVHFSIDDFGTGYSSLAYLSTLPIDSLKIDRSFVLGMDSGSQNVEIVRTVLQLGHTLGKTVVAEGIETAEQLQRLQRMGVDKGQGYLMSRPLPAERVREILLTRNEVIEQVS